MYRPVRWLLHGFSMLFPLLLLAQQHPEVYRYDALLARFEASGQRDSFLYYAAEKARLARAANLLELWAWIQVEIHDRWSDDPRAALQYLDQALAQQWRPPADSAESEPLMYLQAYRGYYLMGAGRVWKAVEAYEAARDWYERYRFSDPDFEVSEMLYKPLGNGYTRLGDNEKALVIFQKALAATPAASPAERAGLYNNIGIAQWNEGDFEAAEAAYRQGLNLPGLPAEKRALLYTGLAAVQLDRGQALLARQTAETALRCLSTLGTRGPNLLEYRAYARRIAGSACTRSRQYAAAGRFLDAGLNDVRTAFGPYSRDAGKTWIALSECLRREGRLPEALDAANRALQAVLPGFSPRRAEDNPDPAGFYEENTIFEALQAKADAAVEQYRRGGDAHWLHVALECHDLAWQAEAVLRKIFQYRSAKIGLQNDSRTREGAAMNIVRLLYEKTGDPIWIEKALALAERSKAALLAEDLQNNLIRQHLAGSDPRIGLLAQLKQGAAFFERNLLLHPQNEQAPEWRLERDALNSRIAALERAVYRDYPNLSALDSAPATQRVPSLLNKIPEGEILAEYFFGDSSIDILVLNHNRALAWRRLPFDAGLQQLLYRYLDYFKQASAILGDPAGYLETAFGLWQRLAPPEILGAERLTVVPDGLLNFIPFEALVTAYRPGGNSLRSAAYWIRRQEIRYAWSLATLDQQNRLHSPAPGFLLGIAPRFEHGERGLAPLGAGDAEWAEAGGWKTKALNGPAASISGFMADAGRYRVLHLYTHAYAGLTDSLPPQIELYDEALSLPDIYALPLHADLVVLSACQTGLGTNQKGEGVMSLARAFAQAGAACILSSLWTVNDRGNARLFRDFYRFTRQGKPVAAALRRAKLAYLDDTGIGASAQSPYFWAGMVMVGSDRALEAPYSWTVLLLLPAALVLFISGLWWIGKRRRKPGK